jgi:hypothetical protein
LKKSGNDFEFKAYLPGFFFSLSHPEFFAELRKGKTLVFLFSETPRFISAPLREKKAFRQPLKSDQKGLSLTGKTQPS